MAFALGNRRFLLLPSKVRLPVANRSPVQKRLELERIRGRGAFLVIVEIDKDIAALFLPGSNACRPSGERLRAVVVLVPSSRAMPTDVDEVRGTFPWRRRVVMIGETKRDVMPGQQFHDGGLVPARMTKFEAVAALPRKQLDEGRKPLGICFEVWRQLKQNRP